MVEMIPTSFPELPKHFRTPGKRQQLVFYNLFYRKQTNIHTIGARNSISDVWRSLIRAVFRIESAFKV